LLPNTAENLNYCILFLATLRYNTLRISCSLLCKHNDKSIVYSRMVTIKCALKTKSNDSSRPRLDDRWIRDPVTGPKRHAVSRRLHLHRPLALRLRRSKANPLLPVLASALDEHDDVRVHVAHDDALQQGEPVRVAAGAACDGHHDGPPHRPELPHPGRLPHSLLRRLHPPHRAHLRHR
jgi:hypothetical protein